MTDITKCINKECSKKYYCFRYKVEDSLYWQSYAEFKEEDCKKEKINAYKEEIK